MERFRVVVSLIIAAAFAGCNSSNAIPNRPTSQTAIKHVIIMMQENRSFNNVFAGFPGADTTLTGACEKAPWCKTGTANLTPVKLESTGHLGLGTDIDHSHHGFEIECDFDKSTGQCRNDGFDKIRFGESGNGPVAKLYPYAYIDRSETKAYWDFAARYALADHFFMTDTASSFIAHQIDSLRHRCAQRQRIADRPARFDAVGLRRQSGRNDAGFIRTAKKPSTVRSHALRNGKRSRTY